MGRPRISPVERLLRYTREEGDCLVWTGALTKDGYGKVTVPRDGIDWRNGQRTVHAHRLAWELTYGEPPPLPLDHLCRNRRCIRVDHLEPVATRVNVLRGEGRAAENARKTRCTHGHLLSGANLYVSPEGYRYCRTCRRRASREAKRRLKEVR